MSLKSDKVSVDVAIRAVGEWEKTYQWIPVFGAFPAIATAIFAGANNLPAPVCAFICYIITYPSNEIAVK